MQEGYISLRAFAREHQVRLSAVQKAIKSERVKDVLRNERGFAVGIHAVNAWSEWQRNTDQGEAAKSGKVYPTMDSSTVASTPGLDNAPAASLLGDVGQGASALPAGSAVSPPAQSGAASGAGTEVLAVGFQDHRTKREKFLAEQAELEYLEKVGALVSVDQVDREVEDLFTLVKSNVFRIIPKKSAILAAETDPGRIERLLTDAITQAFNESSRTLADDTAGGVEERAQAVS